jgi:hypothetical protein
MDELVSKVEFNFLCLNLPNLDTLSKTDAYIVIEDLKTKKTFQTEVVNDDLNPKFTKSFEIEYFFEKKQPLRATVYDKDDNSSQTIGSVEFTVSDVMGSRRNRLELDLKAKNKQAKIVIIGEVYSEKKKKNLENFNSEIKMDFDIKDPLVRIGKYLEDLTKYEIVQEPFYEFTCSATKVDKKDFFGKSDPFFTISKKTEGGDVILVYKSEVKKITLNPVWGLFQIDFKKLCNSDENRPMVIEVFDWDRFGDPEFIGKFEASLSEMKSNKNFNLISEETKKKKKNYLNSGVFNFDKIQLKFREFYVETPEYTKVKSEFESIVLSHIYNENKMKYLYDQKMFNFMVKRFFLDYISANLEISLMVAVDFTGSNGDASYPNSLHYLKKGENQYQKAIREVGGIVAPYDYDQSFPVFGFGGIYRGDTSHCFPLGGSNDKCEVKGVDGMLDVYTYGVKTYSLSGPTNFENIIRESTDRSKHGGSFKYNILMIITDGEISDMSNTIRAIINSSHYPISIIIVGVGMANFGSMEKLDADGAPLSSGNEKSIRDNVQFVPFRDFFEDPSKLAEVTLAELPRQIVEYFAIKNPQMKK